LISASKKQSLQRWNAAASQAGMERETWEGRQRLLSELSIFGWLRFHSALLGVLQPDRHPGEFEFHYLKRGRLNWWVEDSSHEFLPGSVFVIQPNQLHGADEQALQPCEHLWFRIRLPAKPLPGLTASEFAELKRGLQEIKHVTFPVSTNVAGFFDSMLQEHRSRGKLSCVMARSMLHAVLATVIRDYHVFTNRPRSTPLVTWRIRKALEILEVDADANQKIADLARKVGLSESGFRERFKAETGFSPHEYMLDRRVAEARRRLQETGDDITRIALDLGFASSQYFATVFRRLVGMSPGEYRRRHPGK
jgi:AraC-like DNA-binding protein/quercetin dioxygenase-like cupin family protein